MAARPQARRDLGNSSPVQTHITEGLLVPDLRTESLCDTKAEKVKTTIIGKYSMSSRKLSLTLMAKTAELRASRVRPIAWYSGYFMSRQAFRDEMASKTNTTTSPTSPSCATISR